MADFGPEASEIGRPTILYLTLFASLLKLEIDLKRCAPVHVALSAYLLIYLYSQFFSLSLQASISLHRVCTSVSETADASADAQAGTHFS